MRDAVDSAAQIFLTRSLFKRRTDSTVIYPNFVQLHYPAYWHYDVLAGLKVMAEAGYVHDERCRAALELLRAKQLADGGFPAEATWYRATDRKVGGRSLVEWGPIGRGASNPWITAEALGVLRRAGRLLTETDGQEASRTFPGAGG